jgi:hypothetical protein
VAAVIASALFLAFIGGDEGAWVIAGIGATLMPVTIGIAVLRYGLYDIDRLTSRTIAYGLLTAIVAGLFVGGILLLQAALAPLTQSNDLAVAGSTLLVFTLFPAG